MKYIINKKEINIPEEEIEQLMTSLKISEEEAINTWLCDNDYIEDEEEVRLTKKAKDNRIMQTVHQAKAEKERKKREVVRKANPTKERVIADIAALLKNTDGVSNLRVENIGKIITFNLDGNDYKIDLIQKRKK